MWKTVIYLGLSFSAVLAIPLGEKNIPILPDNDEIARTRSEIAMTNLNLPSNATSIRADIVDGFTCANKTYGYYADVDNDCQIFHVCLPVVYPDGKENTFRWSFICPEETLFSQESFTCVRGEDMNFGCSESEKFYELNRNFGNYADNSMEVSSMEADLNLNMEELLRAPVEIKGDEYKKPELSHSFDDLEVYPTKKIEIKKEQLSQQTTATTQKVQKKKTTIPLRTTSNRYKTQSTKRMTMTSATTKYLRRQTTPKYERTTQKPVTQIMEHKVRERTTVRPTLEEEKKPVKTEEIKNVQVPLLKTNLESGKVEESDLKESEKSVDGPKIIFENTKENEKTITEENKFENVEEEKVKVNKETKSEKTTPKFDLEYQNDEGSKLSNNNEEIVQVQETKNRPAFPPSEIGTDSIPHLEEPVVKEEEKLTTSDLKPQEIMNEGKLITTTVPQVLQEDNSENKKNTNVENESTNSNDQQDLIIKAIADLINEETSKLSAELENDEQSKLPLSTNEENTQKENLQIMNLPPVLNLLPSEKKEINKLEEKKVETLMPESMLEKTETDSNLQTMNEEKEKLAEVTEKQPIVKEKFEEASTQKTEELKDELLIQNQDKLVIDETQNMQDKILENKEKTTNAPVMDINEKDEIPEKTETVIMKNENQNLNQNDDPKEDNVESPKLELSTSDEPKPTEKSQEAGEIIKPTEIGQFIVETNLALDQKNEPAALEETKNQSSESENTMTKTEAIIENVGGDLENAMNKNEEQKSENLEESTKQNLQSTVDEIKPIFHRIPELPPIANLLKSDVLEVVENLEPKVENIRKTDFSDEEEEKQPMKIEKMENVKSQEFQSPEFHKEPEEIQTESQKTDEQLSKSSISETTSEKEPEQATIDNSKPDEKSQSSVPSVTTQEESENLLRSDLPENSIVQNFPESQISLLLGESSQQPLSVVQDSTLQDLLTMPSLVGESGLERSRRMQMARNLRNKMDPRKRRFLFRSESS